MMVILKTARELKIMREAGRISAVALRLAGQAVRPGVSTEEIDRIAHDYICSQGAVPSFLGYNGYPKTACISVNDEVIHGIPSRNRILQEGDIVSIDLGAFYEGYHGDTAATFAAGTVSDEAQRLIQTTKEALEKAILAVRNGARVGDIGNAVQRFAEARGYSVVRKFVGHGVGASLHEAPEIPNYGEPGRGVRLVRGMTFAIEPMINAGDSDVHVMPDGWTVKTADGSLSAHFEHTVAITDGGVEILTLPEREDGPWQV